MVVAGDDCTLAHTIVRLGVSRVSVARDMETARSLCEAADACVVVLPRTVPDELPCWSVETEAPGRGRIPALLIAEAVTPFVRLMARRAGYRVVISRGFPRQMLYRCISALLQGLRQDDESGPAAGRASTSGRFRVLGSEFPLADKFKLQ